MLSRRRIAALAAEFLGAGVLAFVVLTVSRSQLGYPYFVAMGAGLAIVVMAIVLGRDVYFNPAYTIGMWTARRLSTIKMVLFVAAQMLGGFAAYGLYKYFAINNIVQAPPIEQKATVLVGEAFGAFVFAFGAASVMYRQLSPTIRAAITGAAYALGMVVASVVGAAFINPSVAIASNAWAWGTTVAGPLLGALVGVNLYALLFADRNGVPARAAAAATTAPAVAPRSARTEKTASKSTTKKRK